LGKFPRRLGVTDDVNYFHVLSFFWVVLLKKILFDFLF